MGVRFACHHCGIHLNIKSELAGRRSKCPKCGGRFRIPYEDAAQSIALPESSATAVQSGRSSAPQRQAVVRVADDSPAQMVRPQRPVAPQHPLADDNPSAQAASDQADGDNAVSSGENVATAADKESAVVGIESSRGDLEPSVLPVKQFAVIDENPAALWYVRPQEGGQFGPAAGDLLRQWILEGRVAATTLLWREDWPQWIRADVVLPERFSTGTIPRPESPLKRAERGSPSVEPSEPSFRQPSAQPSAPLHAKAISIAVRDPTLEPQAEPPGKVRSQRRARRATMTALLLGCCIFLVIALVVVISLYG